MEKSGAEVFHIHVEQMSNGGKITRVCRKESFRCCRGLITGKEKLKLGRGGIILPQFTVSSVGKQRPASAASFLCRHGGMYELD